MTTTKYVTAGLRQAQGLIEVSATHDDVLDGLKNTITGESIHTVILTLLLAQLTQLLVVELKHFNLHGHKWAECQLQIKVSLVGALIS